MGESCFIIPTCQRADGTHVESKLFEDLWKASGNYEWAETQYKIATDPNFLETVSLDAVFDKNGQITAKSFMDITGITFTSDEIKKRLSERWEDKSLPTEEVPTRVGDFNANEELKDDFVPVVEGEGEVVKFTISQRTPSRVADLQRFIENHEVLKVISQRLKDLGVAYDFVGERERYGGRFSTRNAETAFDGLRHLIEIADGADVEETLIEESAHLATLACKDSTFINRLLNAINESTVRSLFTEDELQGVDLSSKEAKLELAGKLVAKAMKNELTPYKGLLNNIKRIIYKVFGGSNLATLFSAKARAKAMAERLARGFIYDENLDINEAIKTPVTLYSAKPITAEGKKLKEVLDHIKKLGARVKTFSSVAYNDVYRQLNERAVLGDDDYNTITVEETMGHMTSAVDVLLERLSLLAEPLSAIDEKFFDQELSTDAINQVYEADSILQTLGEILISYRQLGLNSNELEDSSLRQINDTIESIKSTCERYKESLEKYKFLFAVHLMREVCGRESIDLAADVCFSGLNAKRRGERSYSMEDIVSFYNDELTDTSTILTFIRTYSNHKDVTTQVFYNIVRQAKAKEAIDYNDKITELMEIEKQWKEYAKKHRGVSTLDLFERLDDGSLTGYFRGDIKRGQFARDKQDVIRRVKQIFLESLEMGVLPTEEGSIEFSLADFKKLTKAQRHNLFNDYLEQHPLYQRFMKDAYEDKDAGIFKAKYIDNNFISDFLSDPEFKELYDKITQYKMEIDSEYLTDISDAGGGACHGVLMRVPQFKESPIRRIFKNDKLITNQDLYDYRHTREICEDVTSDYFGSPLTEEVALKGEDDEKPLDLRKLALYGINLLEEPNDVSTDIFKSLELYTEMACRFHTSQAVASRLELFHSQLNQREVASDVTLHWRGEKRARNAKNVASNKRENILRNLVYAKTHTFSFKDRNSWKPYIREIATKAGGVLGAFAAIRALCIAPIAGIKNYIAGYRVLVQDVRAGVLDDVTLRDVARATWQNMAPKHFIGEVGRVLFGETMTFDHYQKLVDRWDSYRTPSKIHRKKGFHPLQTLVNIAMANYSTTDNALVGTIYYSKMRKVRLYDVNRGAYTTAADAYRWVNDNPMIKEGLLLDASTREEYLKLRDSINAIKDIIANNKAAEDDLNIEIMRLSDPASKLDQLEDFYAFASDEVQKRTPAIRREDGTFKDAEEVLQILEEAAKKLCFSEDQEFKLCSGINDYIISSQGVYGMLNATEFQSNMYTQSLGKIKGYMFGIAQRNFLSNYRITNQQMNHSVMGTVALALWSVFAGAKELSALDDISPAKYRLYSAYMCFLPPAMRSKECVKHMQRCGWDPDQLAKLTSFAVGFWFNLALSLLSRMLYRGNEKAIGEKVYRNKGKTPLDKAKLDGAIAMFTSNRYQKLIEPGILFPEDTGKIIDYNKAYDQMGRWEKSGYRRNQRDESFGYFVPGTKEFADREQSYILRNISYNTQDPMYYMAGAFYRLTRGIRDEGVTLMNPLRYANDVMEMANFGNSIAVSGGLMVLTKGIYNLFGNQDLREKWLDREINFYLNKVGFTYDSTPADGNPAVQLIDWYGKQEKIERYQEQERALPQPWN